MVLFRGVGNSARSALSKEEIEKGYADKELKMMPISSFSSSFNVAQEFAFKHGSIISVIVPASRIFSTPLTGNGCTGEKEVVVLGGKTKTTVMVKNDNHNTIIDTGWGYDNLFELISKLKSTKGIS
jgi:hypothetical protein